MLEFVLTTFVFGSKDEFSTLPKKLISSWMEENKYAGLYGKSDIFSVVILPDCEDNELVDVTINSILLTANRNLLHEIIIISNECQDSGKDIKSALGEKFLDKPLIKIIETEMQELGELQNLGANNSTGEIIMFVSAATLFPINWMSPIMRSLSDNFNSIIIPGFKRLEKNNWRFSTNDPVYSPKMMFTKNEFELINIHTSNNKVPMFYSKIFATTKSWWEKISGLSDPTINLIFKAGINLDISLRSWSCGGRVAQIIELSFGVTNVKIPQPSFEMRQILLESWLDDSIVQNILNNSKKLNNFMKSSSSLFEALINKRKELIKEHECDKKTIFTSNFYNELNEVGLIEYPKSQIISSDNGLCFTLIGDPKKRGEKNFELKLLKCKTNENTQSFYIDSERNIIRHMYSNTCLSIVHNKKDPDYENKKIVLVECDQNNIYTHIEYWKKRLIFGSYCIQPKEKNAEMYLTKCIGEDHNSKQLQEYFLKELESDIKRDNML
ncbi:UDP-N-acetyl-D-galactosamine:polypeptide N-acetylgalactosaminyltransferase [Cryptosporidium ubiquitum]|uniref:UDP-N-acetyl-D-galactosamine:polypeptide N-acetylgalactosaminyltransferase n=1 Tax=Cryptosporidium ubiquitum TaxID=857276 RepID=A0A1J4MLA9_9CRYT|nr:UDP-N-acetyl-D-galactosamine:polypeptide N-acetylgalactosaminyltransferase [Cryptosporidium ubiquitum]OII74974.1 UDP-N-acetyl-D-galactosamine:polypeptide N-acetylgalactosaminyltransferase [Cryptosporidium ubiquitum]